MFRILCVLVFIFSFVINAHAHMMLAYTPETFLEKAQDIEMRLMLTNPTNLPQVLPLQGINDFYVLHQCLNSEIKKIDLKSKLKEVMFKHADKNHKAFAATIAKAELAELGDYVFCVIPDYYYDNAADAYLQQITKVILNVGEVPGNFHAPANLPCEIVPLCKPYALWKGNVFTGRVLSQGKPVPHAEIEVVYLNQQLNVGKNIIVRKNRVNYPYNMLKTQTIYADVQGYFSYGLPLAGWWGFAALNVGPEEKHEGKDLSQDAVIWVQAYNIN